MSPSDFTENSLVEKPTMALFGELGWEIHTAKEESYGPDGTLGRETRGDVVLFKYLKPILQKLNPSLPPEALEGACDALTADRGAMGLEAANREIYTLLKEGLNVSIPDHEHGGQKTERVNLIDWENPLSNHFLLVSQITYTGPLYNRRPDLVGYVNGLPLIVIELKKPGVPARNAFDDNLTCYKTDIPKLFWYNALMIASNGTASHVGSLTADWGRYFEWKRIENENEPRRVTLEVMIRGLCEKKRFLDLLENFTLFSEGKKGLVKIVSQNHQFLGVNNAIASMLKAREMGHGRGGVFWQTQGSGKSYSMVFFAQKVLRKLPGNWTFVIATDRVELDVQISKTFKSTGAVSEAEGDACHAKSGAHLRELLKGNHRYIFTLVHKFQSAELLSDRNDIIILTDEAHRSQYDTLALNMRSALPKAMFLAFTGTPLIAGEERTKEVFGDYVSIYDFQQSIEDGATVPLFYENRTPELKLENPNLNEDLYRLIEEAELSPEQEARLEQDLSRQYHLITRDERLETVAKDIVRHFLGRGFIGKAMVVSIDKATALKMHDKVKRLWNEEIRKTKEELGRYNIPDIRKAELDVRLKVLQSTDMALVVSSGQNEIAEMKKLGLDIEPHRRLMNGGKLEERFKDPDDSLRLAFVCAMWLTGFDAPSCSTIYLDKPMRNHTLMQTIARANRVYEGKHSGMIVDYANVFASLEKALAIYGAGGGGKNPVRNKADLIRDLRIALAETREFFSQHHVDFEALVNGEEGTASPLNLFVEAREAFISPDQIRNEFYGHERLLNTLYQAIKPDKAAAEFRSSIRAMRTLGDSIREGLRGDPVDISEIMGQINVLLDASIGGTTIAPHSYRLLDLSKIDFVKLKKKFKESQQKKTEMEALKAAIKAKLDSLLKENPTRKTLSLQFDRLIEEYNTGSRNIDDIFQALLDLAKEVTDEEDRHVRENLTEKELAIFDILTRPAPELSKKEIAAVKKVAKVLLEKVQGLLVINWREKSSARSQVRLAIEDYLDQGLPRAYTPEMFKEKCATLFEHVYENFAA